jgi:hypothetical protein
MITRRTALLGALDAAPGRAGWLTVRALSPLGLPTALLGAVVVIPLVSVAMVPVVALVRR